MTISWQKIIRWLFMLLIASLPFVFGSATSELFELNKMMFVYLFAILITSAWAARSIQEKRFRRPNLKKNFVLWGMLAFLLSQVTSTFFSVHPATSWLGYYSRFHGGLLSTITYILLCLAMISNLDRRDLRPLLLSLLFSALGIVLYALPEHFGLSFSCVLLQNQWNTSCWQASTNPFYRIFGTLGQPNWLAAYLIMIIPLAGWHLQHHLQKHFSKNKSWPNDPAFWIWAGINTLLLALTSAALIFTKSRSGIAGLVLGLAFLLIVPLTKKILKRPPNLKKPMTAWQTFFFLPAIVIISLVFLLLGTPWTPSARELPQFTAQKLTTLTTKKPTSAAAATETNPTTNPELSVTTLPMAGTDSLTIRKIVWQGAWQVWQRYPFFGSGVETFGYSYYQDRPVEHNYVSEWDFLYNKAHNEFLNTLANSGAVGLGSLLFLMIAVSWQMFNHYWPFTQASKQKNVDQSNRALSLAWLAGYIALAVSNFFGFSTVTVGLFFFLWPALDSLIYQKDSSAKQDHPLFNWDNLDTQQKTGLVIIALLSCFLLFKWWTFRSNDILFAKIERLDKSQQLVPAYRESIKLTKRTPALAQYWEQRAMLAAKFALALGASGQATSAAELANDATTSINQATQRNPVHLNIWKTRGSIFLLLSSLNPQYLQYGIAALESAHQLAPTDPKIIYNLALFYEKSNQPKQADQRFKQAIELKPNYDKAREDYAKFLTKQQNYTDALEQYRYLNDVLKPGENLFDQLIASLEAELKKAD